MVLGSTLLDTNCAVHCGGVVAVDLLIVRFLENVDGFLNNKAEC